MVKLQNPEVWTYHNGMRVQMKEIYKKEEPKKKKRRWHGLNCNYPPHGLEKEMLAKGEVGTHGDGYKYVKYKDYVVYKHKLVVLAEGRKIPKGHGIHHKDFNKSNNNPNNLLVCPWDEHRGYHRKRRTVDNIESLYQ